MCTKQKRCAKFYHYLVSLWKTLVSGTNQQIITSTIFPSLPSDNINNSVKSWAAINFFFCDTINQRTNEYKTLQFPFFLPLSVPSSCFLLKPEVFYLSLFTRETLYFFRHHRAHLKKKKKVLKRTWWRLYNNIRDRLCLLRKLDNAIPVPSFVLFYFLSFPLHLLYY